MRVPCVKIPFAEQCQGLHLPPGGQQRVVVAAVLEYFFLGRALGQFPVQRRTGGRYQDLQISCRSQGRTCEDKGTRRHGYSITNIKFNPTNQELAS